MESIADVKRRAAAPPMEDRSAPFWSWNDRLDQAELLRQVRGMRDAGMGGFFIHSREGLETPYLSDEWMEAVKAVLREAKKLGMEAWIYDDDKWPSGNAGGQVGAGELAAKALTLEVLPAGAPAGACAALFYEDGSPAPGEDASQTRLAFRVEASGPSEWYNGSAPADLLDRRSAERFLELTHERYKAYLDGELPKLAKGFFTDEPNFCDFFSAFTPGRPWLPWTGEFARFFLERRGYGVMERLPHLFFDMPGAEKTRHDYWRTLTELFDEAWCRPIYEWCGRNGMLATGHMLYENDLGYMARVCGAAMPHYRYLHVPGIDLLGEQTAETLTVKQCTSAAHQLGRERVVSETYGCTGWQFGFEGQKRLLDWQFVMGVNVRCQHLAPYSIRGCRKRDYPPVFHYQTTWWKQNRLLEDYAARLAACLKSGEVRRDLLVLHPMSTIWMESRSAPEEDLGRVEMNMGWLDGHIQRLNRKGAEYGRMARMLLGAHRDFDFGDELTLAENGAVEGGFLRVGQALYSAVAVPRIRTLLPETAALLERFLRAGGKVFWVGPFPACADGAPDPFLRRLLDYGAELVPDYERLIPALDGALERDISIAGRDCPEDSAILSMVRRLSDGYVIFLCNDSAESRTVRIRFSQPGPAEELDLFTGEYRPVPAGKSWTAAFPPFGSRLYFVRPGDVPDADPPFPCPHPHRADKAVVCLGPAAAFSRTMENTLPLDVCSFRLGDGEWSAPMPVWQAQRKMREALGMRQVYYNGAPQRYLWLGTPCEGDGTPFALRFTYTVRDVPRRLWAAVEDGGRIALRQNGEACAGAPQGYLLDRRFQKLPLPPPRPGENELILEGRYCQDMELEDICLAGGFAVDGGRALAAEPEFLHFGDWCLQGYPHYAGGILYRFDADCPVLPGGRLVLKMGAYAASVGEVRVNGVRAGWLVGRALDRADVTGLLREGRNRIEIELTGSPRNLFGPFHQAYTGCSRISWADFRTEGACYTPDYVLHPYGIFGQAVICEAAPEEEGL